MNDIDKSQITTIKEFSDLIGEFKDIWHILIGKRVTRFTALKFTSGNRYLFDKDGSQSTIGYATEAIVDGIDVRQNKYFITVSYSTDYNYFDKVTGRSQPLYLNAQLNMLLNSEYDETEFIERFNSIYPPITIVEINLYISRHKEELERKEKARKTQVLYDDLEAVFEQDIDSADFFYYLKCFDYISLKDYGDRKATFLQKQAKDNLFQTICKLLFENLFDKADKFYKEKCTEIITLEEYQIQRNQCLKKFLDFQKSNLIVEIKYFLEKFEFKKANDFYQEKCTEVITLQEYQRYRNKYLKRFCYLQKPNLMTDLRYFLERFQFEDAKKFYQEKCTEVITQEEYRRELNLYLNQFHNLQRDKLMNQLENFWEKYQFEDAESFYHSQCAEIITLKEYQEKCNFYLNQFRNLNKSRLMNQLKNFWEKYQFEDAESFYHSQCAEIITLKEYQVERNFYLRRLSDLYKPRLNIAMQENFLSANMIYQSQYRNYINLEEYKDVKQKLVQQWIRNNLNNTPDLEQSLAIGSVNSHVQVIARAGSGKTSTLVNRAIFLQKHCGIKPSEILLLAFNKKAAQEIRARLHKHLQDAPPYALTFHSLAYHLVHPDETLIFDEPDGQQTRSRSLQSVIDEYRRHPDYSEQIQSLMIAAFRDAWLDIVEGGYDLTEEEMIAYRRSLNYMGIDGWEYKSFGEKIIADFLFEHDIPFKYEKNFWWNSINYHPDFTILKEVKHQKGIVIEYFGLQGDPNYDEQSQEKRRYWQNQFDYFFVELNPKILKQHGREAMENHLREKLARFGLAFNRLSTSEIWERIKERAIDDFTKSMTNFIGRCRKQCLTPNQLSEKIERYFATNPQTSEPEFQFLDLAQNFYISYLDRLQQTGEEDFDGLMQRAAKVVDEGNTIFLSSKFRGDLKDLKYIMIDEYQDFSLLFHNLITAIRKQNPEALFFCVGDDWQAINGFAGADLYYYKNFTQIFKPSHTLPITTNYRSGSQIVEIGIIS